MQQCHVCGVCSSHTICWCRFLNCVVDRQAAQGPPHAAQTGCCRYGPCCDGVTTQSQPRKKHVSRPHFSLCVSLHAPPCVLLWLSCVGAAVLPSNTLPLGPPPPPPQALAEQVAAHGAAAYRLGDSAWNAYSLNIDYRTAAHLDAKNMPGGWWAGGRGVSRWRVGRGVTHGMVSASNHDEWAWGCFQTERAQSIWVLVYILYTAALLFQLLT